MNQPDTQPMPVYPYELVETDPRLLPHLEPTCSSVMAPGTRLAARLTVWVAAETTGSIWLDVARAVAHCQTCLDMGEVFVELTDPGPGARHELRPCPDCSAVDD